MAILMGIHRSTYSHLLNLCSYFLLIVIYYHLKSMVIHFLYGTQGIPILLIHRFESIVTCFIDINLLLSFNPFNQFLDCKPL